FTHKGLSPNLIDDIKGKLKKELKKSEAQDLDYIEYRRKSPAEIILTIQRNLFTLQLNPIVFFIINFILLSYLYDKQYVPRSEEHTSELQSRFDLVCRLLLEK